MAHNTNLATVDAPGRGAPEVRELTERKPFIVPPWLCKKLEFLNSKGENRASFFGRIAEIFPQTDSRYRLIERAYETAKREFETIYRDDGERYFEHLRAVALVVVVYLRVREAEVIAAALLHDLIEDIKGWDQRRVEQEFGARVAELVWWLSKPSISDRYPTKGEVDRKYHRKLRDSPREVILIKVSDRLHNLITSWTQELPRLSRKIAETKDFILPLAEHHQLLIHELEDVLSALEEQYGIT